MYNYLDTFGYNFLIPPNTLEYDKLSQNSYDAIDVFRTHYPFALGILAKINELQLFGPVKLSLANKLYLEQIINVFNSTQKHFVTMFDVVNVTFHMDLPNMPSKYIDIQDIPFSSLDVFINFITKLRDLTIHYIDMTQSILDALSTMVYATNDDMIQKKNIKNSIDALKKGNIPMIDENKLLERLRQNKIYIIRGGGKLDDASIVINNIIEKTNKIVNLIDPSKQNLIQKINKPVIDALSLPSQNTSINSSSSNNINKLFDEPDKHHFDFVDIGNFALNGNQIKTKQFIDALHQDIGSLANELKANNIHNISNLDSMHRLVDDNNKNIMSFRSFIDDQYNDLTVNDFSFVEPNEFKFKDQFEKLHTQKKLDGCAKYIKALNSNDDSVTFLSHIIYYFLYLKYYNAYTISPNSKPNEKNYSKYNDAVGYANMVNSDGYKNEEMKKEKLTSMCYFFTQPLFSPHLTVLNTAFAAQQSYISSNSVKMLDMLKYIEDALKHTNGPVEDINRYIMNYFRNLRYGTQTKKAPEIHKAILSFIESYLVKFKSSLAVLKNKWCNDSISFSYEFFGYAMYSIVKSATLASEVPDYVTSMKALKLHVKKFLSNKEKYLLDLSKKQTIEKYIVNERIKIDRLTHNKLIALRNALSVNSNKMSSIQIEMLSEKINKEKLNELATMYAGESSIVIQDHSQISIPIDDDTKKPITTNVPNKTILSGPEYDASSIEHVIPVNATINDTADDVANYSNKYKAIIDYVYDTINLLEHTKHVENDTSNKYDIVIEQTNWYVYMLIAVINLIVANARNVYPYEIDILAFVDVTPLIDFNREIGERLGHNKNDKLTGMYTKINRFITKLESFAKFKIANGLRIQIDPLKKSFCMLVLIYVVMQTNGVPI